MRDKMPIFKIPKPQKSLKISLNNLPRPLIIVHPFCGMAWRQWSKFEDLLRELPKLKTSVVVIGNKDGYMTSAKVHNLVNKLSLAELFWVISQADVFVTADSGPMHIAFALDVPTVALFGPVKPSLRIPPQSVNKHTILYKQTIGSEKVRRITQRENLSNSNMQQISVEEALNAVKASIVRMSK